MRKRDLVFGANLSSNDQLVDIVEFVPVLIPFINVSVQGLELGSPRYGHIKSFCGIESPLVEQVEIVGVKQVGQKLRGKSVQRRHDGQVQMVALERLAVDIFCVCERLVIVEPLVNCRVLVLVQIHPNGFQRIHIHYIVSIVERWLLIVKRRKPYSSKVPPISFLPSHHNPHCSPLSNIHWLDHTGDFIHKGQSAGDVIKHVDEPHLLPWHWHILQKLQDRVRNILESPEIDSLIPSKLFRCHITVVLYKLAQVLWGKIFLLQVHKSKLALSRILLLDHFRPLLCFPLELSVLTLLHTFIRLHIYIILRPSSFHSSHLWFTLSHSRRNYVLLWRTHRTIATVRNGIRGHPGRISGNLHSKPPARRTRSPVSHSRRRRNSL
mmetsp:Transcript_42648/g.166461  ORF Transcript_42648/g.166461 Transcript_42648/m.166461 type:complete len:380 (-) Transcript_42648:539-1678(-)